jgi:hypothetical protein
VQDASLRRAADAVPDGAACADLARPTAAAAPAPRYLHAAATVDSPAGGGGGAPWLGHARVSLCDAVPCWEARGGAGPALPHAHYALLGLLAAG